MCFQACHTFPGRIMDWLQAGTLYKTSSSSLKFATDIFLYKILINKIVNLTETFIIQAPIQLKSFMGFNLLRNSIEFCPL